MQRTLDQGWATQEPPALASGSPSLARKALAGRDRAAAVRSPSLAPAPSSLLARWLDTEPEVPQGEWFKRFSGMTVCGEGEFIKTFLLPGQHPKGVRVE